MTDNSFMAPRDVMAADAPELRDAILAWLDARAPDDAFDLEPGAAPPSPLVLQMIVALSKSDAYGRLRLGGEAEAVLADIGEAKRMETAA